MLRRSLFIFLMLFASTFTGLANDEIFIQGGELSLDEEILDREQSIELSGDWYLYWNLFIDPQNTAQYTLAQRHLIDYETPWSELPPFLKVRSSRGFGSYELVINANQDFKNLALHLPELFSSYRLFLNGDLIAQNGEPGTSALSTTPYWLPKVVNIDLHKGENRLIMHVANFHHAKGGPYKPIRIGDEENLAWSYSFGQGLSLFIVGALLISAIFSLVVFYFQKLDLAFLFYGLFALAYSYRVVGTDLYFIHNILHQWPWSATLRLEYGSLYLSVIFFSYFYAHLIERKLPLWVFHLVAVISALGLLSLFLAPATFTAIVDYYIAFLAVSATLITTIYLIRIRWSHSMSWFTSLAILALLSLLIIKGSDHFGFLSTNLYTGAILYLVFIVTQTIALSQRFGYNLRQHVSASESAQLKQQHFLNSISHEIRTPMNAILGMLEFVDDSDLNKEQRSKLETVRKNSQDLNKILLDLLNFSAFDSGKLKLEKVKFSFRELVKNACEHAELRAKESKVEFDLHIDEEIPDEIVGDAEKLEQVIYHIVGNAFKFTEKGKISLRVELKDCEDNQLKLKYTVTDTGIGIHSDQLERVLNDFSQGEEGNTRKYGGTGIGLSLSARIVEHMGGELWIDSQFGKGTIVEWETNLATPRIDLSAKAQELKQDHAKIEGNIHILYAEDNPINQKLMVMMLKNLGLEVDTALNGLEAWEMALTKSYHVIFMDVQMPKMDGIESTRRIIKDVRQRPIIIAVTANAEVADQKRCIEAGMNDFISKPFTAKNIKDALIKWQGLIRYMEEDGNKDVLRIIS